VNPPSTLPPGEGLAHRLGRWGRRIFPRRLFCGLAAVVAAAFIVKPTPHHWGRFGVSFVLVLVGLGLRAWAAAYAGAHTRSSSISAPRLVTSGPYGYVRNPIYLGTILLGIGMTGLIGDVRLVPLLLAAFIVLYATIIPAEERFLAATFGDEYARYCHAVPRLIPRLTAWNDGAPAPSQWANARGEAGIAGILLLIQGFLRIAAYIRD
jgi:protein-S-isoprenylcysteine O-methyltransferase Ste14